MFSNKYEGKHIVKFNYPFCGAILAEQELFYSLLFLTAAKRMRLMGICAKNDA